MCKSLDVIGYSFAYHKSLIYQQRRRESNIYQQRRNSLELLFQIILGVYLNY